MKKTTASEITEISERLSALIAAELAGRPALAQGAILADMLAMWLAGHIVPDNKAATDAMRAELLSNHVNHVAPLVEINHKRLHGPWKDR